MKKFFRKIIVCLGFALFFACKTPSLIQEDTPSDTPKSTEPAETKPEQTFDTAKIEGLYVGSFFTSKTNSDKNLTYAVEFHKDKTARLLIFKNEETVPSIFPGKWLKSKDEVIILYFENRVLASEFFLKRPDGSLSILQANRKEYTGELYEYMHLIKLK